MNKRVALLVSILSATSIAQAQTWDVNGFISVSGGAVLDDGQSYFDFDDSFSFDKDSKLGLQIDLEFNKKWGAAVQGVVRGADDWEAELDWAYLSYAPAKNWQIRAGRLRGPFYMISDYLEVGYAYPWLRPPREVYDRLPITSFDGIDVIYSTVLGEWDVQAQTYVAKTDKLIDFYGEAAKTKVDHVGLAVTGSNDWLSLRASYHYGKTNITVSSIEPLYAALTQVGAGLVQTGTLAGIPPLVDAGNDVIGIPDEMRIEDKDAAFLEVGFVIDPGERWFARGEWTGLRYDRHIIPESTSYYATGGMRDREFTYFLTFAKDSTSPQTGFSTPLYSASAIITPVDPVTGATIDVLAVAVDSVSFPAEDVETWTFGFRWDFLEGMALKAEYAQSDTGVADVSVVSFAVDMVF